MLLSLLCKLGIQTQQITIPDSLNLKCHGFKIINRFFLLSGILIPGIDGKIQNYFKSRIPDKCHDSWRQTPRFFRYDS